MHIALLAQAYAYKFTVMLLLLFLYIFEQIFSSEIQISKEKGGKMTKTLPPYLIATTQGSAIKT